MRHMIFRMCWNSRGWRMPTHTSGDGGYPSQMGFGHEEWNFQVEDAVDGFVYGYLYYRPSAKVIRDSGGHFRIGFWSIHPDTRQKLIVGFYNDATIVGDEDYPKLHRAFTRKRIYERRAEELASVVPRLSPDQALREVQRSVEKRMLNFKCPADAVKLLPESIPLRDIVGSVRLGQHFTTPTFVPTLTVPTRRRSLTRERRDARRAKLAEDAYYRESPQNLKRIIRRHNALSTSFANWLEQSGYQDIAQQRNYVDVTFAKAGTTYRAELKTCYGVGTTKAIREALGQVLEYNLYPGRDRADSWAIVIDERPAKHDIEYLLIVRRRHRLPLALGWKEGEAFVFPDGLGLDD